MPGYVERPLYQVIAVVVEDDKECHHEIGLFEHIDPNLIAALVYMRIPHDWPLPTHTPLQIDRIAKARVHDNKIAKAIHAVGIPVPESMAHRVEVRHDDVLIGVQCRPMYCLVNGLVEPAASDEVSAEPSAAPT